METIVDFKQSNPSEKREEWMKIIISCIAAYAMAHDYVYGSKIEQGVIMVCTPDLILSRIQKQKALTLDPGNIRFKTIRHVS